METYLLSTVVAPSFDDAVLEIKKLTQQEFVSRLPSVTTNLCGHPATVAVLKQVCPTLPEPKKAFWQGDGIGLCARPRGGIRGASTGGDAQVSLDDLEFCQIVYRKT